MPTPASAWATPVEFPRIPPILVDLLRSLVVSDHGADTHRLHPGDALRGRVVGRGRAYVGVLHVTIEESLLGPAAELRQVVPRVVPEAHRPGCEAAHAGQV